MPLYFIRSTLYGGSTELGDPIDLPDDQAAWAEATTSLGELLRNVDGKLTPPGAWELDVIGEDRTLLFSLRLTAESHVHPPRK